jgi:hypothetical protein
VFGCGWEVMLLARVFFRKPCGCMVVGVGMK